MLVVCLAALAASLGALAGSAAAEHRCARSRDSGWCNQHTVQWYFDSEYGDCLQFWYSGCDGNGNRFDSERDCAATCRAPKHWRNVCQLPPVPGPCQQRQTAWHYDAARTACVAFVYSGCLGNNNRFTTRLQCESECGQLRRYRLTMNETAYTDTSHYHDHTANDPDHDLDTEHVDYYDSGDGYAMTRHDDSDGSVDDNDEATTHRQADTIPATTTTTTAAAAATKITTPSAPAAAAAAAQPSVTVTHTADASVCHLPDRQPGDCDNYIVRYSHVHHYRQCAPFYYSGCGGNGNNFASLAQCQYTCITATATATAATATPTAGHASDTNVHTHRDDSHSQMDIDLQNQQQQQQQQQQSQQQQQQHGDSNSWLGVLRQSFLSYDSDSQTQQQANSGGGGSGGGDGDFELSDFDHERRQQLQQQQPLHAIREEQQTERGLAEEEQQQQQQDGGQLPQLCWLDKDGGPCFDYLYRYFYDRQLGACRQFIYSGCHGNANRFHTLADCERHCIHPATTTTPASVTRPASATTTRPATGGESAGREHSPPDYQYGDAEYYGESAPKDYIYY